MSRNIMSGRLHKRPITLGEINYGIALIVKEINRLIDNELLLEDLTVQAQQTQEIRTEYEKAYAGFERKARALRDHYSKLIEEVVNSSPSTNPIYAKLVPVYQQHLGLSEADITTIPPPPVVDPVFPKIRSMDVSYIEGLKQRWRHRRSHIKARSHVIKSRAERHLSSLSQLLAEKRMKSLRVQRRIRVSRANIRLDKEEIDKLVAGLRAPPRYIYETEYQRYCNILQCRLTLAEVDCQSGCESSCQSLKPQKIVRIFSGS